MSKGNWSLHNEQNHGYSLGSYKCYGNKAIGYREDSNMHCSCTKLPVYNSLITLTVVAKKANPKVAVNAGFTGYPQKRVFNLRTKLVVIAFCELHRGAYLPNCREGLPKILTDLEL